jgi:hypothetical protein
LRTYQCFNSNGVSVLVTDDDLDAAAGTAGPLSAELAEAAAQARRIDLVANLRRSLEGDDRAGKLTAAKALLALQDHSARGLLEYLAPAEDDAVVAKSYSAVATRLRGPQAALEMFCAADTDPQLARLLVSNYNSHLRIESGDITFLVTALKLYRDKELPWLKNLPADLWDNAVYIMLVALTGEDAVRLLREPAHQAQRSELLGLLPDLIEQTADGDIVEELQTLRAELLAAD